MALVFSKKVIVTGRLPPPGSELPNKSGAGGGRAAVVEPAVVKVVESDGPWLTVILLSELCPA